MGPSVGVGGMGAYSIHSMEGSSVVIGGKAECTVANVGREMASYVWRQSHRFHLFSKIETRLPVIG